VPTAKALIESQSSRLQGENKMNPPDAARRLQSRPLADIGNLVQ
jgi:hypothetical protein